MNFITLVVVTLGEFQSTRKAYQHLTLKTTKRHFGHISLDSSSDSVIRIRCWEQLPVVWFRGISGIFGHVWDKGRVKVDVNKCLWNGSCFWKRNIDLKWVEKCTQIKYLCGWGAVGITWARFQLFDFISGLKSGRRASHHLNWQAMTRLTS